MNQEPQQYSAHLWVDCKNILGESIVWDDRLGQVIWTDIHGRAIHLASVDGQDHRVIRLDDRIGSFALTQKNYVILAGFSDGVYLLDLKTQAKELYAAYDRVQGASPFNRLNDGRCDRQGRFLVGGVEETALKPEAKLIRVDGKHQYQILLDQVGCSNGLSFSPDGFHVYHSDSRFPILNRYDYDIVSGTMSNPRQFLELSSGEGIPDGTAIDSQGGIWVALFNGGRVHHYLANGQLDIIVHLPVSQVTCCCLGGKNLDQLFITTASEGYGGVQHSKEPLAGSAFYFNIQEIAPAGIPESKFTPNHHE